MGFAPLGWHHAGPAATGPGFPQANQRKRRCKHSWKKKKAVPKCGTRGWRSRWHLPSACRAASVRSPASAAAKFPPAAAPRKTTATASPCDGDAVDWGARGTSLTPSGSGTAPSPQPGTVGMRWTTADPQPTVPSPLQSQNPLPPCPASHELGRDVAPSHRGSHGTTSPSRSIAKSCSPKPGWLQAAVPASSHCASTARKQTAGGHMCC